MTECQARVQQCVRDEIQAIQAYHVQAADNMVKLDAMENPYTWTPSMQQEWLTRLQTQNFNRYPDPTASELRAQLMAKLNLPKSQSIVFGNGSDELIQLIIMALAKPGAKVLAPTPTFVMYDMISRFVGVDYVGVALQADFSLDMDAMLSAIETHQPAVIFLAYPNNPTGNAFAAQDIEKIIRTADGLVVVDEAYNAFAEDSFIGEIGRFANLVVMRTFSKVGLAGFRLGYMVGDQAWMQEFDKVRLPYNINVLTQSGVAFALEHEDVLQQQAQSIKQERAKLVAELADLPGVHVYPTQANFITLSLPTGQADSVFAALKQEGILIKNLSPQGGLLADCLRVTVGTLEENAQFLSAFRRHLPIS